MKRSKINMVLLIDTNIIIDVLKQRGEFYTDSKRIFDLCELQIVEGHVSALSIANLIYILRKELDPYKTKVIVELLDKIFKIEDLRAVELLPAARQQEKDFEDALQAMCARRIKADYIVTRNQKDFPAPGIPAISPHRLLEMLESDA